MTCKLCGWEPTPGEEPEVDFGDVLLDAVGVRPVVTHDCAGRRIEAVLAKERSRIAVVIRRVAPRWRERGALELARLLDELANAIEQETA